MHLCLAQPFYLTNDDMMISAKNLFDEDKKAEIFYCMNTRVERLNHSR